jgi:biotin carboxyl carrier protein
MKYRVTIDEQTFDVEVGDLQSRPVMVTVDGETFAVHPESSGAQLLPAAPAGSAAPCPPAVQSVVRAVAVSSAKVMAAPIPGTIVAVLVKAGDSVKTGQELCTLEAMKMKNAIRANRDGTIANVLVANGDSVKHGQPLVEFTE